MHEHRSGAKGYRHPAVGDLKLHFENLDMPGEPSLHITVFNADDNSPTADKLILLASWAATQELDAADDPADAED